MVQHLSAGLWIADVGTVMVLALALIFTLIWRRKRLSHQSGAKYPDWP